MKPLPAEVTNEFTELYAFLSKTGVGIGVFLALVAAYWLYHIVREFRHYEEPWRLRSIIPGLMLVVGSWLITNGV